MDVIESVRWSDTGSGVCILDQRELPGREVYRDLRTVDEVFDAIRCLAVRGAPAIGIVAAMGATLAVDETGTDPVAAKRKLVDACDRLDESRPTAVNLHWAVERMKRMARAHSGSAADLRQALKNEASRIASEDRHMCRAIGEHGAPLIQDGARVITHCNAGALATGGIGTALAAIYLAVEQGKHIEVFADETRPLLQGSRLTAWELTRAGIPTTVLVDGAAASLMQRGRVDLCIVGADRIARNGDVANKIGTYGLAIAAKHHGVPFYVAAPSSTFDSAIASGEEILIEQRSGDELRCASGRPTAPDDASIYNPAFDVTPASLITAIISDRAVHRPPYEFASVAP